jgi:hypothetical protein
MRSTAQRPPGISPALTPTPAIGRSVPTQRSTLYSAGDAGRHSDRQTLKVGLVLGCRPAALRQAMKRWSVAGSVAGSPQCSMIATLVAGTSRMVTSSIV